MGLQLYKKMSEMVGYRADHIRTRATPMHRIITRAGTGYISSLERL